jgi:hypothetical protein
MVDGAWGMAKDGMGGGAKVRVGMKYFPVHECIALFSRPDVARAEAESFSLDISRERFRLRDVPRRALSFSRPFARFRAWCFLQDTR